jgi:thiol-disulfide isomerase/thioredoxin
VLLGFWIAWCGPCRMFGPVFDRASERHDAVFGKVDHFAPQLRDRRAESPVRHSGVRRLLLRRPDGHRLLPRRRPVARA